MVLRRALIGRLQVAILRLDLGVRLREVLAQLLDLALERLRGGRAHLLFRRLPGQQELGLCLLVTLLALELLLYRCELGAERARVALLGGVLRRKLR